MGVILEFRKPIKDKLSSADRLKLLAEGKIETYTCTTCHGDFEVIDESYPDHCPCCGLEMEW